MQGRDPEILRLSDRVYELAGHVQANRLLAEEALKRVLDMEPKVSALARKDEIAEAVAQRLKTERRLVLSVGQKLGGALLGALIVADFVRSWM